MYFDMSFIDKKKVNRVGKTYNTQNARARKNAVISLFRILSFYGV